MADESETFTVRIVTEADQSLAKTAELNRQIVELKEAIRFIAVGSRQSFGEVAESLRILNDQTKQFHPEAITQALEQLNNEAKNLGGTATQVKKVGDATEQAGNQAQQSVSKFSQLGSIMKYVFGAVLGITAIGVLRNFIGWLEKAAESGVAFAKAAFQMEIGVRALQRAGVDISIKEVYTNLDKLRDKFKIFTTKELVTGSAAFLNLIRDMGFTKDQIFALQDSIATLAVVNGRAMDEVQRTVALALSSGYTEGLQRLGVSINRVTIAEKAAELGWDRGYTALTEQQRAYATYLLVLEKTSVYQEDLAEYYKTLPGQIEKTNTAVKEQTNAIGSLLAPLELLVAKLKQLAVAWFALFSPIVMVGRVLAMVGRSMQLSADILELYADKFEPLSRAVRQLVSVGRSIKTAVTDRLEELSKRGGDALDKLSEKSERFAKYLELVKGYYSDLQEIMTGKPLETMGDTGVATKDEAEQAKEFVDELVQQLDESEQQFRDDSLDAWEDYQDDLAKINRDGLRRVVELWIDFARKLADIETELQRDIAKENADLVRDLEKIDLGETRDIEKENRDTTIDIAKIDQDEARANADAYRDYNRDLADIDRDATQRKADAERDYRNREIAEEQKFQEKMRQLREDFLFDLEDAVAARDARQIMRLIRQYNKERQQSTRDYELEKQERATAFKNELADIERQRQIKRQERAIDLQEKLADIARDAEYERQERYRQQQENLADIRAEAELERQERNQEHLEKIAELKLQAEQERQDAQIKLTQDLADLTADQQAKKASRDVDYRQQIADLKQANIDRQREIAAGLAAEYDLTASMLDNIQQLLLAYYGSDGVYMQIVSAFYQYLGAFAGSFSGVDVSKFGTTFPNSTPQTVKKYGQGGWDVADKPTLALYGDAGPELAQFTPLNKLDRDVNSMLGKAPGQAGANKLNGKVEVALWLSPDLESRIINNTLDATANVILSVNKARTQKGI